MKYNHPTIVIDTPAAGHYVIRGHAPKSTFVEGAGHIVPMSECYISPEVPTEALEAIIADRKKDPVAKAAVKAAEEAREVQEAAYEEGKEAGHDEAENETSDAATAPDKPGAPRRVGRPRKH